MSGFKQRGYNQKRGDIKKRRDEKDNSSVPENASPTVLLFKSYQIELDAKYDKYERLVKKSRDLTIESKRIIFLLHRVGGSENDEEILNEAKSRLFTLLATTINAIGVELNKREVYQYIRAFTNGLQEFVEAVSFYYYLKHGNVISLDIVCNPEFYEDSSELSENSSEIKEMKKSELPLSALLKPTDYILGIADLTGELMRKCINLVGSGDIEEPFKLSVLLQSMYQALLVCGTWYSKDLKRKLFTLKNSVQKVENACYAIKIRGTEIPKHMLADFFSTDDEVKDQEACDI